MTRTPRKLVRGKIGKLDSEPFSGFPKEGIAFLRALKRNNDRDWFNARKDRYEEFLRDPSRAFIESMRPHLKKISPSIVASPRAMTRIYRDTRFSEDKTPYKTWLAFMFRDSRGEKDFSPAYYLGYDPSGISYGAGTYVMSTLQRDYFRNRIMDEKHGEEFRKIVKKLRAGKRFQVLGKALKKFPLGFDSSHPNAEFLLHNGLYVSFEEDLPAAFFTAKFVDRTIGFFKEAQPLFEWLAEFTQAVPKSPERFLPESSRFQDDF